MGDGYIIVDILLVLIITVAEALFVLLAGF
jgi:hypothetical protein